MPSVSCASSLEEQIVLRILTPEKRGSCRNRRDRYPPIESTNPSMLAIVSVRSALATCSQ
jgi:hypothetical protein